MVHLPKSLIISCRQPLFCTKTFPFSLDLQFAFQDESMLYFLTDAIPSLSLYELLDKEDLSEAKIKHIFIEIFIFLQSYFPNEYRFLCPEQVYINVMGHVVLNFAYLANLNLDGRGYVYGYEGYISPQKFQNEKPNYLYGLGVLLFEMNFKRLPQNQESIDLGDMGSVIEGILTKQWGFEEVCKSAWLKDVDWMNYETGNIISPLIGTRKNSACIS